MTTGNSCSVNPSVEIIIPHYRGDVMLDRCISSLAQTTYRDHSVCIVDNLSGEAAANEKLKRRFSGLRILQMSYNAGFAGGCNAAFLLSSADYVVFMNDDALVEPDWLDPLVEAAEADRKIAALQPKILSLQQHLQGQSVFDYAGAAGGLIDRLGYPYCYGRTLYRTEPDRGQYDHVSRIFWASGVAMFVRRSVIVELGGFDEDFFMHMEEIDLSWRLLLSGYRIVSVPASVVYHEGGASLAKNSPEKTYLNHRNNLVMLLKNRSMPNLFWIIPLRLVLEGVAVVYYLFAGGSGSTGKAIGVLRAIVDTVMMLPKILGKRKNVQEKRQLTDSGLFKGAPLSVLSTRISVPWKEK